ncbi:hypothetical protein SCA6_003781 [Theobroma cacao]
MNDLTKILLWFANDRHGIRQFRTGWADGPAYITQCPIRGGQSYTYKFTVEDQRGTLLWHAHHSWQRASVYGAFIIYPRMPYPFSAPIQTEIPVIFGEWWNADVDAVENEMLMFGKGANSSDGYTINGLPGPLYPCSVKARPYLSSVVPFDNSTTVGFLKYKGASGNFMPPTRLDRLQLYNLPELQDTAFATRFDKKLRSLASSQYPCNVPKKIDKRVITTISLNLQDCPANQTCKGYKGGRFYASMNNFSFVRPQLSMLEAYYHNKTAGVFTSDFPENPPKVFDYAGVDRLTENMNTEFGTKLFRVPHGTYLEIVLQGTNFLHPENHPIHVHGHNFFIVGSGFGNFNVSKDPDKYNLIDPPERNTVGVPMGGWAAIRLKADNPGVWFIHCHLEEHTSWGLAMAFVVENGPLPSQSLLPPPEDLPQC